MKIEFEPKKPSLFFWIYFSYFNLIAIFLTKYKNGEKAKKNSGDYFYLFHNKNIFYEFINSNSIANSKSNPKASSLNIERLILILNLYLYLHLIT